MKKQEILQNINNAIECVATLYEQLEAFFFELRSEMEKGDPRFNKFGLTLRSTGKHNRECLISSDGRMFLPEDLGLGEEYEDEDEDENRETHKAEEKKEKTIISLNTSPRLPFVKVWLFDKRPRFTEPTLVYGLISEITQQDGSALEEQSVNFSGGQLKRVFKKFDGKLRAVNIAPMKKKNQVKVHFGSVKTMPLLDIDSREKIADLAAKMRAAAVGRKG